MKKIFALLLVVFAMPLFAAEEAYQFDNEQQRILFKQLNEELRCPRCQNQNIADSNALVSKDMRDKVFELLKQGYNREQVLNYMIDRYGYFVHYQPPKNSATAILWIAPVVIVLLGFIGVYWRTRGKEKQLTANVAQADALLKQEDTTEEHKS